MTNLNKILYEIRSTLINSFEGKIVKPTILFCGCSTQIKRDLHKRAKNLGFNPEYKIKHPYIKVELQNSKRKRIEIDKYKTITINYNDFDVISKYLESLN